MALDARLLLTVAEAGKRLGLSRNQTYDLVAKGVIPSLKLGERSTRIAVPILEEWVRNGCPGSEKAVSRRLR